MPFVTPKVDWVPRDFFNIEDWERIRGNLIWLNQWLIDNKLPSANLNDIALTRGEFSLPTITLVNALEENLQNLYDAVGINLDEWAGRKTWYSVMNDHYRGNPNSNDWNRWEQLALSLHNALVFGDTYFYNRVCGTFYLGDNYRRQLFSRTR